MSKPEHITVTVASLSGSFDADFDVDQKLQDIIDKAFLTLDIKPDGEEYSLYYKEMALDPNKTIEEQKIPDGATLMFATEEGGGGCQWK